MSNPYYYTGANPTVNLVLIDLNSQEAFFIQRSENASACPNMWAFPGGFVDTTAKPHTAWLPGLETPEIAAWRELAEETSVDPSQLNQKRLKFHGIYEGNGRDPRDNLISWSKSHVFYYIVTPEEHTLITQSMEAKSDAKNVSWISFDKIKEIDLAFDHKTIFSNILTGSKRYYSEI